MTTAPLSLTVTAPEFGEPVNGVYKRSGTTPGGRLGAVDFSVTGGVGTKSARIKSQPEWAGAVLNQSNDNPNNWTLGGAVGLPPLPGMSGLIIVEIKDSAVSPAAVEATLELTTDLPAGQAVYRSGDHQALRFVEAEWPVVMRKRVDGTTPVLRHRNFADVVVRQHADGRCMIHADVGTGGQVLQTDTIVKDPGWTAEDVCREMGPNLTFCILEMRAALQEYVRSVGPPFLVP